MSALTNEPSVTNAAAQGDVTITADHLTKIYRVQKKPPGLLASVKAVFARTSA